MRAEGRMEMEVDNRRRAEEIYSVFLERALDGDGDFDRLLSENPQLADRLREIAERNRRQASSVGARNLLSPVANDSDERATPSLDHPRYEVTREVGRGGMGVVLEARDRELNRTVAIKLILAPGSDSVPALDSPGSARFHEESLVTAQLDHPGIVPLYERGFDGNGRPYFAMRFVRGRELGEIFELARARAEGWNFERAVGLLVRVCQAVAYAHSKGVIHRDLKPSNIMVGLYGEAYVTDWGVAKATAEERTDASASNGSPASPFCETLEGSIVGTPSYMSPEQARGELGSVGARSDVYSLGAILYELLAGERPYETPPGTPARAVLALVKSGAPRPIRSVDRRARPELVAICEKAMSRDPSARYGSAAELAEDLQSWLDGRVVGAYRTGPLAELAAWTKRNRSSALSMAAAGALVVASLAAIGLREHAAAVRITAERNGANEAKSVAVRERREAVSAHQEAVKVRETAEAAQANAERTVVDLCVRAGLAADELRRSAEAALWFAQAARSAPRESAAHRANRLRAELWCQSIALPVRAFRTEIQPSHIAFHPSGRYLSWSDDRSSQIVDLESGQDISLPSHPLAAWSSCGKRVLVGATNTVRIAGFPNFESIEEIPCEEAPERLRWSPSSRFIAYGTRSITIRGLETEATRRYVLPHPSRVLNIEFSPADEHFVITSCADGFARVWRLDPDATSPPAPILVTPHVEDSPPLLIAGGNELLTVDAPDRAIYRFRIADGSVLGSIESPHARGMALSVDPALVVVAAGPVQLLDIDRWSFRPPPDDDDSVYTVDARPETPSVAGFAITSGSTYFWLRGTETIGSGIPEMPGAGLPGGTGLSTRAAGRIRYPESPSSLAISPNGRHLATGQRGRVHVWRLPREAPTGANGRPVIQTVATAFDHEWSAISGDHRFAAPVGRHVDGTYPGRTQVRDVENGADSGPVLDVDGYLNGATFLDDDHRIALLSGRRERVDTPPVSDLESRIDVWNFRRGERIDTIRLPGDPAAVGYDAKRGHLLVACRYPDSLIALAPDSGEVIWRSPVHSWQLGHLRGGGIVDLDAAGSLVFARLPSGPLVILDAETGDVRVRVDEPVFAFAKHPSGDIAAFESASAELRTLRCRTGDLETLPNQPLSDIDFDHSGSRLATALNTGAIRIHDLARGIQPVVEGGATTGAFSARWVGSSDSVLAIHAPNVICAYDARTGKRLTPFWNLPGYPHWLSVAPDGRRAVVSGGGVQVFLDTEFLSKVGEAGPDARDRSGLDTAGLALLTELSSLRTIDSRSNVKTLSDDEWFARWDLFVARYASCWLLEQFRSEMAALDRPSRER